MARTAKKHEPSALPAATRNLFESQLRGNVELPAAFHEAAFTLASRAGDTELVASLAARLDAPKELVEAYSKVKDIPVRVAYLKRSDHTPETLGEILKVEKRASVLSKILDGVAADSPTLETVCEVFMQRPTVALADALAVCAGFNDALPESRVAQVEHRNKVVLKVVEILAPRSNAGSYTAKTHFRGLVKRLTESSFLEDVAAIVAENNLDAFYVLLLSRSGLSADARLRFLETLGTDQLQRAATQQSPGSLRTNYASRLAHSALEACAALLEVDDLQPSVVAKIEEIAQHPILTVAEKESLLSRTSSGPTRDLTMYVTSSGEELEDLLAKLTKDDEPAYFELLRNPNLTESQASTLAKSASIFRVRRNKLTWETMGDTMRDALARAHLSQFLHANGWSTYRDPKAARQRLFDYAVSEWSTPNPPSHVTNSRLWDLIRTDDFEFDALDLPWPFVKAATAPSYGYYSSSTLATSFIDRQVEILGTDANRWETFNSLTENFQGTVAELLEAVVLLTHD